MRSRAAVASPDAKGEGDADREPQVRLDHRARGDDGGEAQASTPGEVGRAARAGECERNNFTEWQRQRGERDPQNGERNLPRNQSKPCHRQRARDARREQQYSPKNRGRDERQA